ncbi:hypothetical protein F5B19DRAFT_163268 [Rostrohypoxylon terebratum]|nr:hypothetical protein F5B19DRAFT_163268 [Rostrohypoxylon terebratum]
MSQPTQIEGTQGQGQGQQSLTIRALKYLMGKRGDASLTPGDLDKLNIKLTGLDLDNGMPEDGGPKLLELAPFDEINDIATLIKFAEHDDTLVKLTEHDAVYSIGEYTCGNWHDARFLGNFFLRLLNSTPYEGQPILIESSPWIRSKGNTLQYVTTSRIFWRTSFCLHLRDSSRQDGVYFLAIDDLLKDNSLHPSEIWCILRNAFSRLKQGKQFIAQKSPATVVSASGRSLRVVQGYVDEDNDCIGVRKSPIIVVEGDKEQNWENLMKIACWFLGSPIKGTF